MTRAHSMDDAVATFPARLAALPAIAAFAQSFCGGHAVGREDALRLRLVIEELFTNTVEHGYGGGSDAPVRIALTRTDDGVAVTYEDRGPPFDPLARPSRPADAEAPGGFGVLLVAGLTTGARYAYEGGANRVWLSLRRRS